MNNVYAPNSAQLDRIDRAVHAHNDLLNVAINIAEVHSKPISDQNLIDFTGVTAAEKIDNPLPDDAMITDPFSVFYPGLYDSNAYRIPALYNTLDGTLIAGIDK